MTHFPRLAQILRLLGIPPDAISTIASMYSGATTRIGTPYGPTAPVPLRRGTIQGCPLSPLLFLLYISPLTQWLEATSPGRPADGYLPGCFSAASNRIASTSEPAVRFPCCAYADDLALLAPSLDALQRLLHRVEAFSRWACLPLNLSKCYITGLEHGGSASVGSPGSLASRCSRVTLCDAPLTFLPPDRPFRYLGIEISMTLAGAPVERDLSAALSARIAAIESSHLSYGHQRVVTESLVFSKLSYALPLGLIRTSQLDALGGLLRAPFRRSFGLPPGFASDCLHFPPAAGGLGFLNIHHLTAAAIGDGVVIALTDPGRLGRLSRCLARAQLYSAGGLPPSPSRLPPPLLSRSLWLRRLSFLSQHHHAVHCPALDLSALLAPSLVPLHLCRLPALLAAACKPPLLSPAPALHSVLSSLRPLGLHSLTQLVDPASPTPALRSQAAFAAAFPAASASHLASFSLLTKILSRPSLTATVQPFLSAACAALTNPALPRASVPPAPTPSPAPSVPPPDLLECPDYLRGPCDHLPSCLPAQAPFYTDASVFPAPTRVWKHRYHRTHGLQFLCQWSSPALLFPAQARLLASLLSGGAPTPAAFIAGRPALLHLRPHWVPAPPPVLALPAVAAYTTRRILPPPPLGHPLPPVPILGLDGSPLAAILPRTFHPATQIRPPGSPCVLPRARSVFVYGPGGHLSGALPPATLASLWARFCRAQPQPQPAPSGPAFAEALHLLLDRYRDSPRAPPASAPGGALLRGQWTIAPTVLRALSRLCSTDHHLLTSPLSAAASIPAFCPADAFPLDSAFGATCEHGAFRYSWAGSSVLVTPVPDGAVVLKAVRHTIASAAASPAPFLACVIAPAWPLPQFSSLLGRPPHPHVFSHTLCRLPPGVLPFTAAASFPSVSASPHSHRPRFPLVISLVYNAAGHALLHPDHLPDLEWALTSAIVAPLLARRPFCTLPRSATSVVCTLPPAPQPPPAGLGAAPLLPQVSLHPWLSRSLRALAHLPLLPTTAPRLPLPL